MGCAWPLKIFVPLVTVAVCLAAGGAGDDSPADLALSLVRKAKRAARDGEYTQAYLFYSEAAALQPKNRKYRGAMEGMQARSAGQAKPLLPADSSPGDLPERQPDPFDSITEREFSQARQMLPPPQLRGKDGRLDFDLNLPPRELYVEISHRFDLEPVFDGDFPPSGQPVRFQLKDIDYREALEAAGAATNTFATPLSQRVFMVALDTTAKRNDLEQTIAIAIPVPQALTPVELTEIVQVVRQATNVEKIAANTSRNEIVLRDRISRALPAEALIRQFFSYRPDVLIELQFISVSSSDVRSYGFNLTNQFKAVPLGNLLSSVVRSPASVANLVTFGGGKTLVGLGLAQVESLFTQSTSSVQSLYHAQLRGASGQLASFHVGDRYPVLTAGYFGAPAGATGTFFAPPPSFTYENLGLDLKVTPHVHGMGDVTLTLETSFEILTGQAVNGIPVFGNRKVQSEVRLRNGEWAVVAGLMGDVDSRTTSGFAGLANLPLVGRLFRHISTDREKPTVLIGIRPHLLGLPASEIESRPLRVGSEVRPHIPM